MKLETQCIHAGTQPDPVTNSRAIPVHRTTAYVFNSTEHAADLFALRELGNVYTRIMNPTQDALEQRVAAIEGGAAALAHASGTAAVFNCFNNICRAGDHIVSAANLYGGTFTMFNDLFPQFGYPSTSPPRSRRRPKRSSAKRCPTPRAMSPTWKPWRKSPTTTGSR